MDNLSHTVIPSNASKQDDTPIDTSSAAWSPPHSLTLRASKFSVLLPLRPLLVAIAMGICAVLVVSVSVLIGSANLTFSEAIQALFGEGAKTAILLVQRVRLPRIVAALLAGAALGLSGCLIQTLARNRLASPDILGINDGATFVVMIFLMSSDSGMLGPWWLGPLGAGIAAGLLVFASGELGTQGYRVLVVGLALSSIIRSITELALSRGALQHSGAIYTWSIGSLIGRGYPVAIPVALGLAFLLPIAILAGRQLDLLRFDEATATTLGLNVRFTRLFIFTVAVALAGLAVGIGGPMSFIAIAAPIITSRLVGSAHIPIISSALVGAILVVAADTIGRVIANPVEIPVGVITNIIGGPFLLWVLLSDNATRKF